VPDSIAVETVDAPAVATRPLGNIQYRYLLGSNLAFFLALNGQSVVRSWLVFELTGSTLALGKIAVAFALPMLLVAPFGGVIADRFERRRVIRLGQLAVLASELVLLTLLWTGQLRFVHLLCGTLVMGVAFPLIMPARQAIAVNLVGRASLTQAMAINAAVINLGRVLGPFVAGLSIDALSVRGAYALGAALYLVAILCLLGIERQPMLPPRGASVWAELAEGVRYLGKDQLILQLLLFGLVPMFLAMPAQQLMVVFAQQVWHVGSTGFGVLQGVAGAGGVLGAVWVARRTAAVSLSLMRASGIGFAVLLGLFALSPSFSLAVLLALAGYVCAAVFGSMNNAAIQLLVPDAIRGRVSAFMMMSISLPVLGTLPVGALADRVGAPSAVASACFAGVLAVLAFGASPALRGLDARLRAPS
jgi:MFS family permease